MSLLESEHLQARMNSEAASFLKYADARIGLHNRTLSRIKECAPKKAGYKTFRGKGSLFLKAENIRDMELAREGESLKLVLKKL